MKIPRELPPANEIEDFCFTARLIASLQRKLENLINVNTGRYLSFAALVSAAQPSSIRLAEVPRAWESRTKTTHPEVAPSAVEITMYGEVVQAADQIQFV